MARERSTTTDYRKMGRWAICNPDSDEPTISPMSNPDGIVVGMTEDEVREVISELDDALTEMMD